MEVSQSFPCWCQLRGRPVTCCEGLFGRVAGHVAPAGDEGHLVLGVWLQVPDGVLVLIVREVDGGAVARRVFDPIGELDAVDLSQRLEPGDQRSGVCDVFHLDLAGSVQACDGQRTEQQLFQRVDSAGAEQREAAIPSTYAYIGIILIPGPYFMFLIFSVLFNKL